MRSGFINDAFIMLERSEEHNGIFCSEAVHNKILPFGVVTIQGVISKGGDLKMPLMY